MRPPPHEFEGDSRSAASSRRGLFVGPTYAPDRYELRKLRAQGSEGELWLGVADIDDQYFPVAIKIVSGPQTRALSTAELDSLRHLDRLQLINHANIVKIQEAFAGPAPHAPRESEDDCRTLYSVMEFVPGDDLVAWASRNPERTVSESIQIALQLAGALEYLHCGDGIGGAPLLHRDVKPANVIVAPDGQVRLVDFGLASLTGNNATIVGTRGYLAPEVINGNSPNAAADRYGLGATMYFLLTGIAPNPFDSASTRARLLTVGGIEDRIGFADHVMTMLAKNPANRPTKMVEWAERLVSDFATHEVAKPATVPANLVRRAPRTAGKVCKPVQLTPLPNSGVNSLPASYSPTFAPSPVAISAPAILPSPANQALASSAFSPSHNSHSPRKLKLSRKGKGRSSS